MKIGKTIRQYRKQKNLTQEEVANYLGVTSTAVTKWESETSYPDITLLAPLARILGIDVDTLLSFHEEMTDAEVERLIRELTESITANGYETAFGEAEKWIRKYPNCSALVYSLAQILWMYMEIQPQPVQDKYEKQLLAWHTSVLQSSDTQLAEAAAVMLFQNALKKKKYAEAEELLKQFKTPGIDVRLLQANLYEAQGEKEKTYEVRESILYRNAANLVNSLDVLSRMKCEEKDYEKAQTLAELSGEIAGKLGLNSYVKRNAVFYLAVARQDKENVIALLKEMLPGIQNFHADQTNLYEHMKFRTQEEYNWLLNITKTFFRESEELDFLRGEPEFVKLMDNLQLLKT